MQYYIAQAPANQAKPIDYTTVVYIPLGIALFTVVGTAILTLFVGKSLGIFQRDLTKEQEAAKINIANARKLEEIQMQQAIIAAIKAAKTETNARFDKVDSRLTNIKDELGGVQTQLNSLDNRIGQMQGYLSSNKEHPFVPREPAA